MNSSLRNKWIIALAFAASAFALAAPAQPQIATPQDYAQREQLASPAARQKLAVLRQRIKDRKLGYEVGFTEAMERSAKSLTGGELPPDLIQVAKKQNVIARQVVQLDRETRDQALKVNPLLKLKLPELHVACNAGAKSFDWRQSGKVTPVKRQGCGSCWAYGAMAVLESSYLIRNDMTADGSEQYIVTNSQAGTCKGGGTKGAIDFLTTDGTTTEAELPDSGVDGTPNLNFYPTPYHALVSGFVSDTVQIPPVAEIKAEMCLHGPVVSWVGVNDSFISYTGGTYTQDDDYAAQQKKPCPSSGPPNGAVCGHFVTIIGWNDAKHAWLVKNSWGTNWGSAGGFGSERGFMWIDYDANQIGAGSMWVEARNNAYRLPARYFELMPQVKRIDPGPLKKGGIIQKQVNPQIKQQ